MQTKKRAKAVKFGKKIDKPVITEKEAVKAEPVIEQKQEEQKETPPEKIESKPIETQPEDEKISQPEEQKIPQEEEPEIKEEEAKITETQQTKTDIKEVIIHAPSQEQPNQPPQEPPQEPPIEPPVVSQDLPEQSPEEPAEEKQKETIKVEETEEYVVETKEKKNFLGYFMLIAILSFIIGLLSMAAINYFNQKNQTSDNAKNTTVTKSVSPTKTPSPTSEPLDLSKYNIKILNGSGITGAASELKESLTSEGFTITTTGNAATSNYENTTVLAGKDVDPKYLEKLKSFLSQSYTLASDSANSSESTSGADVTIIIGK